MKRSKNHQYMVLRPLCISTWQNLHKSTFPIILYLNRRHLKSNRVLSASVFSLESLKTQKLLKNNKKTLKVVFWPPI